MNMIQTDKVRWWEGVPGSVVNGVCQPGTPRDLVGPRRPPTETNSARQPKATRGH